MHFVYKLINICIYSYSHHYQQTDNTHTHSITQLQARLTDQTMTAPSCAFLSCFLRMSTLTDSSASQGFLLSFLLTWHPLDSFNLVTFLCWLFSFNSWRRILSLSLNFLICQLIFVKTQDCKKNINLPKDGRKKFPHGNISFHVSITLF